MKPTTSSQAAEPAMNSKVKWTPTPWSIDKVWQTYITAGDERGEQRIGEINGGLNASDEQDAANAAFIVRACNAHDALVEALEAIQRGFRNGEIQWTTPRRSDYDPYHPANTLMCAALALAKGEK